MSEKLESLKEDVFLAAVDWQEKCSKYGRTDHITESASGYLYDRVRRYKNQEKLEENA